MNDSQRINLLIQIESEANRAVAELCNHQKKATEKSKEALKKLKDQIKEAKAAVAEAATDAKAASAKKKLDNLKTRLAQREANLTLSLTTSKQNYIDPRIAVGFAKKYDIDIKKIYRAASMQKAFSWAITGTEEDWDYMSADTEIAEEELAAE
jgi:DNA topoisomerase-1